MVISHSYFKVFGKLLLLKTKQNEEMTFLLALPQLSQENYLKSPPHSVNYCGVRMPTLTMMPMRLPSDVKGNICRTQ